MNKNYSKEQEIVFNIKKTIKKIYFFDKNKYLIENILFLILILTI